MRYISSFQSWIDLWQIFLLIETSPLVQGSFFPKNETKNSVVKNIIQKLGFLEKN